MKFELTDGDYQLMAEKLKNVIQVKYRDELGDIPEHIINTLTQNYIIQAKSNCIDIDKLLDEAHIA